MVRCCRPFSHRLSASIINISILEIFILVIRCLDGSCDPSPTAPRPIWRRNRGILRSSPFYT
ncbi:hypothetical protein LX36DRAFT_36502 [Colletotrichum falcatum]|nr:hypothetical protein LX36DRAFT_36502 [Colletotrichum falcatum]